MTLSIKNGEYVTEMKLLIRLDLIFPMSLWKEFIIKTFK